ncbi:hypothetical protein PPL_05191 [Heterostelium album PN500]|uniref:Nucleolar protein 16 n=1 Tax=Heterostelium pallidum (strain ATCC 26659 / Pp 5 / PN500) TaxID=670386 RepID=D3B9P5_HETP5|nr:hypothetical protein PPL_05191 [Heterostelium album PN500]EFA81957.1 hypothetical protein PPL_05191 [Heterostelium album PN500]|eukprot:XP_020434074.1 hypothetical protein PPL_05191 [Heterostelium album PN500]
MPFKKNNNKHKKQNHKKVQDVYYGNKEVQERWDPKKTTLENYALMGLKFQNTTRDSERRQQALEKLNMVEKPIDLKVEPEAPRVERGQTFSDQHYYRDLILKYNDDYEKMKMDHKINYMQKTAKQLENGCKRFIVLYGHPLMPNVEEKVEEKKVEKQVKPVEEKQKPKQQQQQTTPNKRKPKRQSQIKEKVVEVQQVTETLNTTTTTTAKPQQPAAAKRANKRKTTTATTTESNKAAPVPTTSTTTTTKTIKKTNPKSV